MPNTPIASIERRRLLTRLALGVAAAPLLLRAQASHAEDLPHVNPADPAAKGLAYIEAATAIDAKAEPLYKAGRQCAGCALFKAPTGGADYGACTIFPGKSVNKGGWCRAWAAKP